MVCMSLLKEGSDWLLYNSLWAQRANSREPPQTLVMAVLPPRGSVHPLIRLQLLLGCVHAGVQTFLTQARQALHYWATPQPGSSFVSLLLRLFGIYVKVIPSIFNYLPKQNHRRGKKLQPMKQTHLLITMVYCFTPLKVSTYVAHW